jgi:hypothetical protein
MSAPGLVQVTWPALREYIAVEVKLGIARHKLRMVEAWRYGIEKPEALRDEIGALELQSTILETSFRELLPEGAVADVQAVANRLEACGTSQNS